MTLLVLLSSKKKSWRIRQLFFTQLRYKTLIRWKPNLVRTGPSTVSNSPLNTASSKDLTMSPLENSPRSPPRLPEGQVEKRLAIWLKSAPLASFSLISRHCFSVLTRMCWAQAFFIGMLLGEGKGGARLLQLRLRVSPSGARPGSGGRRPGGPWPGIARGSPAPAGHRGSRWPGG